MKWFKPPKKCPHCPDHGVPLRGEGITSTLWSAHRCIVGHEMHYKSKHSSAWVRPGDRLYGVLRAG